MEKLLKRKSGRHCWRYTEGYRYNRYLYIPEGSYYNQMKSMQLTRKELREKLSSYGRRCLAQKQRQLIRKWAIGKISLNEMLDTESKWYNDIQTKVDKYE